MAVLMDNNTYNSLTECNYDDAWEFVRDAFILKLFGAGIQVKPLPYINESSRYDLLATLVHKKTCIVDLKGTFHVVGYLSDLLADENFDLNSNINFCGDEAINIDTTYEEVSDPKKPVKKRIRLDLHSYRKVTVSLKDKCNIVLDMTKRDALDHLNPLANCRHIYLLTTVYRAKNLVIGVTVGDKKNEVVFHDMLPFAFVAEKRALGLDGTIEKLQVQRPHKGVKWAREGLKRSVYRRLSGNSFNISRTYATKSFGVSSDEMNDEEAKDSNHESGQSSKEAINYIASIPSLKTSRSDRP